jgi:proliferating cell nuclear antigen PCNA
MELSITNKSKLEIFVSIFQILKNWNSIINLQFDDNCLSIQTMDKSHVCLSNIILKKSWFSSYNIKNNCNINVNSLHFSTMMSYAVKHNILEINYDPVESSDKLFINILNNKENKSNFDLFFELPLVDFEQDKLEIPSLDYDVDFIIESKKFNELISELMVFGSDINITCSEENLEFNSSGDSGKLKVNVPIEDLNEYSITEGNKLDISFSLVHIGKMCLSTKLSSNIIISISSINPMVIKYNLEEESTIAFYIAPKVTDD